MPTLAEQLRDAIADYRAHDDAGRADLRARAYSRMREIAERAKATEPTEQRR